MTTALRHPVSVEVVGGATLVCRERVTSEIQVRTAAGPVNITCVECIVLDEEGDKFSLGKDVLSSLGMDVGAMIAELADQPPIQMMMILPTISLLKLVSMSIQTS